MFANGTGFRQLATRIELYPSANEARSALVVPGIPSTEVALGAPGVLPPMATGHFGAGVVAVVDPVELHWLISVWMGAWLNAGADGASELCITATSESLDAGVLDVDALDTDVLGEAVLAAAAAGREADGAAGLVLVSANENGT